LIELAALHQLPQKVAAVSAAEQTAELLASATGAHVGNADRAHILAADTHELILPISADIALGAADAAVHALHERHAIGGRVLARLAPRPRRVARRTQPRAAPHRAIAKSAGARRLGLG
jgi:hypothetical protein